MNDGDGHCARVNGQAEVMPGDVFSTMRARILGYGPCPVISYLPVRGGRSRLTEFLLAAEIMLELFEPMRVQLETEFAQALLSARGEPSTDAT